MKRIILFILFALPFCGISASTDSLYNSAIEKYEQGLYQESLRTFREVQGRGVESPRLYYNMGNAAYRSNNLGYAILYYEKALKMDPGLEEAEHNLKFVSQFKSDSFEQVPELFLKKWIKNAVTGLPVRAWALVSLGAFFVLLTSVMFYIFGRRLPLKKSGFFTALFALLIFLFSSLAARKQHHEIINPDTAIIIAPSVTVKSSPSDSGNDLFILHEGTRIDIDEEVSEWWSIRIMDGRTGWIPANSFLTI